MTPIAAAESRSGEITSTSAPRRLSAAASIAATERETGPKAPNTALRPGRSEPVGFRHSTLAPRSTLAASRLVGLHAPPST